MVFVSERDKFQKFKKYNGFSTEIMGMENLGM